MKKSFKLFLAAAFLVTEFFVVALPLMITSAKADGHPIQAITHAGFGGGTDVTTRMMLLRARRVLKQDMQLVNKKGGGGAASMDYMMSLPADGNHTLTWTTGHAVSMALGKTKVKLSDMQPLARGTDDPQLFVVSCKNDIKDAKKFISTQKSKSLKYGTTHTGGIDDVSAIAFTKKGGLKDPTIVGKIILKKAADKVQRVTMELSGHSPFIVCEDVDMNKVADIAITSKFRNNGQVCISPNRFYIQENRKDEFINAFIEKAKKLRIGNGLDEGVELGPLTTAKRLEEVEKLVEITKKEGAKVLMGGKRPSGFNKGFYYEPTLFDEVKDNFTIMKEEPFGPLVPVLTFKKFDEVIERANDNDLGLCSYLYTNSMDQANRGSEKLESGCVAVNTGVVAIAEAPFGGIKQTGYGREGGSGAIKDYLNVKYTHMGLKI